MDLFQLMVCHVAVYLNDGWKDEEEGGHCDASPARTLRRMTSRSGRTRNLQVFSLPRLLPSKRGGEALCCMVGSLSLSLEEDRG